MRILITGGCGFIGHHFVDHVLRSTSWEVAVVDMLSYASSRYDRLREIGALDNPRVSVFPVDLACPLTDGVRREIGEVDYLVHMAAGSHVDRSVADPLSFVEDNVLGTAHLLEYARSLTGLKKMVYFSTDEVFGPAKEGQCFREWDRYNSGNPYAASKAAGEELSLAYANTFGLPVVITHTTNVFGERQHPEKYIPLVVRRLLLGETVSVHTDSRGKPCSRSYIHAQSVAAAVLFLLEHGHVRDKYNITSGVEIDNLALAQSIAGQVGKPLRYELVPRPPERPGHDVRYSIDGSKMRCMGWSPAGHLSFERSLGECVQWMIQHPDHLGKASARCGHSSCKCPETLACDAG